jgi:hypothetical protein
MLKTALSALAVALLCGHASAAESTYQIDFAVHEADQDTLYTILVSDGSCGETTIKSEHREDFFRVCAEPADEQRVRLDVERRTTEGKSESSTHAVVLATPGSSYDVLDATMTVTVP